MPIKPWRALDPDGGAHYLSFERRFRVVVEDPEHTWRRVWIPTVIACPLCGIDTGLRLAYQSGMDAVVEAACPVGHVWVEPRVDLLQWMAYCRFRAGRQEIEWQWLIDAGFGEEPPPPIDYAEEFRKSAVEIAKYGKRKAKAKVRREIRSVKKKVGKRVRNEAMRPVAALLRTAWTMQAGGVEPVKASHAAPGGVEAPEDPAGLRLPQGLRRPDPREGAEVPGLRGHRPDHRPRDLRPLRRVRRTGRGRPGGRRAPRRARPPGQGRTPHQHHQMTRPGARADSRTL